MKKLLLTLFALVACVASWGQIDRLYTAGSIQYSASDPNWVTRVEGIDFTGNTCYYIYSQHKERFFRSDGTNLKSNDKGPRLYLEDIIYFEGDNTNGFKIKTLAGKYFGGSTDTNSAMRLVTSDGNTFKAVNGTTTPENLETVPRFVNGILFRVGSQQLTFNNNDGTALTHTSTQWSGSTSQLLLYKAPRLVNRIEDIDADKKYVIGCSSVWQAFFQPKADGSGLFCWTSTNHGKPQFAGAKEAAWSLVPYKDGFILYSKNKFLKANESTFELAEASTNGLKRESIKFSLSNDGYLWTVKHGDNQVLYAGQAEGDQYCDITASPTTNAQFLIAEVGEGTANTAESVVAELNTAELSTIKVNFATSGTTVEGYMLDCGNAYGDRGNDYSYGWESNMTGQTRNRTSYTDDTRLASFVQMQPNTETDPNHSWKIALPNGKYRVCISAGDNDYTDSHHVINANGVTVIDFTPTTGNKFGKGTATVEVTDGFLTLAPADNSSNAKINYVEITSVNVNVTIAEGWGYASLCYGDYSLRVPNGCEAYTFSLDNNGATLRANKIESGIIPAGTGVIIKGDADKYQFKPTTLDGTIGDNLLKGTDTEETVESEDGGTLYMLSKTDAHGVGFYKASSDGTSFTNGAHKAYLELPGDATQVRVMSFADLFGGNGTATAIETAAADEGLGVCYDLSGRCLNSRPATGLYIINGTKVIVR